MKPFSVSEVNVQFGKAGINYYDEFINLIRKLDCSNERILLIVDEFSQTILNISGDEGDEAAIHFLESNRALRQMPEIQNKVQFIYAGSIGLENIVSRMNVIQTINDLNHVSIGPFTPNDAGDLILALAERPGLLISPEQVDYILKKIEWLIPYYIQLIIQELDTMTIAVEEAKLITNAMIDTAFDRVIGYRNYFENWHTRLRATYKKDEYNFAKEILNRISEHGSIQYSEIIDAAAKYKIETTFKDILNALKHDGYIDNAQDPRTYRFNSPLLKAWWYSNVAY